MLFRSKTYVYAIAPDGTVSGRREFAPVGYDGITTDERGNVYICDDGIHIYSPAEVFLERIPVPTKPSNVCFGGKDIRPPSMAGCGFLKLPTISRSLTNPLIPTTPMFT